MITGVASSSFPLRGSFWEKIGKTPYLWYLYILRKNILLTFSTPKKNKKYKKSRKLDKLIGRRILSKMAKKAKVGKPRYRFLYNHLPDGLQKLYPHRTLPQLGS